MSTTEAAELARTILTDSEDEHPDALYLLNVREARTLAHAALAADRVEELAEELRGVARESYQVDMDDAGDAYQAAADLILAVLNGETNE